MDLISGHSEKNQLKINNMSDMYYNEAEEFRERNQKMVKLNEQRADYGRCSTPIPNANPNNGTCAQIPSYLCGMTYRQPVYEPPKSDQEIYYRSIGNENQKLLQEKEKFLLEKQKLILQVQALQNEVRKLKEANYNYTLKENKSRIFKDFFLSIKEGSKLLYQDIIKWFNT